MKTLYLNLHVRYISLYLYMKILHIFISILPFAEQHRTHDVADGFVKDLLQTNSFPLQLGQSADDVIDLIVNSLLHFRSPHSEAAQTFQNEAADFLPLLSVLVHDTCENVGQNVRKYVFIYNILSVTSSHRFHQTEL